MKRITYALTALLLALVAAVAIPTEADAADPRPHIYNLSSWEWADQLDANWHDPNFDLPGAGDAALVHIATPTGIAVFSTSANGNTYRHDGPSFDELGPGVWVFGPHHAPIDGSRYAGIVSVIVDENGVCHGWVHMETWEDIASIGYTTAADCWNWTPAVQIIEGQDLQANGFRGAASPRVVPQNDGYTMLYDNRHGNGRWATIHKATAPTLAGPWTLHGHTIDPPRSDSYTTLTPSVVWSTHWQRYLIAFWSVDGLWLTSSHDLETFTNPRRIQRQPNNGARWYPNLIDFTQVDSTVVGAEFHLTAHRITDGRRGVQTRRVAV